MTSLGRASPRRPASSGASRSRRRATLRIASGVLSRSWNSESVKSVGPAMLNWFPRPLIEEFTSPGERALAHERVVEAAVAAAREDLLEEAERVVLGRVALRRVVRDRERRARRLRVLLGGPLLLFLPGLGDVGELLVRRGRDRAEVLLDPLEGRLGLEVARHDERGVARRVEGLEERLGVLEGRGVEVLEVAVEVVRVEPVLVRDLRHVEPREPAVRPVQDVDLDLVLHDALLVREVLLRDREAAHAVGLGPERGLERVRGHDLEVVREVEARRAVQDAAVRLDELDELHLPEVLRALEHEVLEEVGEAGPVARLDPEPDVVVDGHDRRGGGVVGRQDHLEAVRELPVVDGDRGAGGGGRRLRGGGDRPDRRREGECGKGEAWLHRSSVFRHRK